LVTTCLKVQGVNDVKTQIVEHLITGTVIEIGVTDIAPQLMDFPHVQNGSTKDIALSVISLTFSGGQSTAKH
jgi:hypothetical protein